MRLMSTVRYQPQFQPKTGPGKLLLPMIHAFTRQVEDVDIWEELGDNIQLGCKFDTVLNNFYMRGVLPHTRTNSLGDNPVIWTCSVEAFDILPAGMHLFSAAKGRDKALMDTGMFYCPYIPLMKPSTP